MDIVSMHKEDKTAPLVRGYIEQLVQFYKDRNFGIWPSWETTLFKPDVIGPHMSAGGIVPFTYFVEDISDMIYTMREFFSNGITDFQPQVDNIVFKIHADATDVIFDNLIICSLVNTSDKNINEISNDFPMMIELNKLLSDYMAPEILSTGSGATYHDALRELAKRMKTNITQKRSQPHKSLDFFKGKSGIYPAGIWPLKQYYPIPDANMIYFYISTLSLKATIAQVEKRWPNASMRYSAFKVHSGHYGHKVSVNVQKGEVVLDIAVVGHQLVVPFINKYEMTPLFNLFIASCVFFSNNYHDKGQRAKNIYGGIMGIAADIILKHLDAPVMTSQLVGPIGAARYTYHTRQIISIKYNSNPEKYITEDEEELNKFDGVLMDIGDNSDTFVIPVFTERDNNNEDIIAHGGRMTSHDLMVKFDLISDCN